MQVGILGPVQVRRDGQVVPVPGARLCALLVRLAVDLGRPVPVPALIDAVWPEKPPAEAVNALQTLVSRLRRVLGAPDAVRQSAAGYELGLGSAEVDSALFEKHARLGRQQLRAGEPAAAAETLRTALGLWRGQLPAGIDAVSRARLDERRLEAVADRIDADLALGRSADVVVELETLCAAHPLRERFAGQLMTALAGSGRQGEALAVYGDVRARLAEDLGVDPSAQLRGRQLAVLRGDVPAPPAPARPDRTNLRAALTPLLGRDTEIGEVEALLAGGRLVTVLGTGGAGKTRLAAEVAAGRVETTADGVWFVELASVADPAEVPPTVLAAVGLRESTVLERRSPRPPRDPRDRLVEVLAGRADLLVLDNCEHMLDAAATLADLLLARCPRVRILATSREPLGIVGEALAPLAPLPVPDAAASVEQARALAAVQLFTERTAAVFPGFVLDAANVSAVVEIVRRLDGLPLAIELAAARTRAMPVAEIATRLCDRFRLLTGGSRVALPRHRTLRAVVDWSWDLLTPAERLLAERVAVFPAGVTADTAVGVCADDRLPAADIPDLLLALLDKSLVHRPGEQARYRMLETLREYGADRLAERREVAGVRRSFAGYFARFAAEADALLRGRHQLAALRRLEAEHDNLLAALRALCDDGEAAAAVELALALSWFWTMTDRHAEAATWLGTVLDLPGQLDPAVRLTARAVHGLNSVAAAETTHPGAAGSPREPSGDPREGIRDVAGELAAIDDAGRPVLAVLKPILLFFAGDLERSGQLLDAAVGHPDPWVRAVAHFFRARFAENAGDLEQTRADVAAAHRAFTDLGDTWGLTSVLPMAAQLRVYDGDLTGALAALEEARGLLRALPAGDADLIVALQLSDLRLRLGDPAAAREQALAALAVAEARSGPEMQAIALALAGSMERLAGNVRAARDLQRRAESQLGLARGGAFGADHGEAVLAASGALIDLAEGDLDAAAGRLAHGYEAALRARDQPIAALVGLASAAFALAAGEPGQAARVLGAAARLRGADDPSHPDLARIAEQARARLGGSAYAAAWQRGRALDPAAALAELRPGPVPAQVRRA